MTVYLVDEPFIDVALSFAAKDSGARIVLLQDAVYSSRRVRSAGQICVIDEDVERRGLKAKIPPNVQVIGYDGLVKMMEEEKVVNFL
jgi:sulfur relay protein TusB/DsrH